MMRSRSIFVAVAIFVPYVQATAQPPVAEFDRDVARKVIDQGVDKLLFVRRKTFQSSHYYTRFIDGCVHYGGRICILDLRTGKVNELLPDLAGGIFGTMDLSFDAKRIVFAWKKAPATGFKIYEYDLASPRLRQLTFDPPNEKEMIYKYRLHRRYPLGHGKNYECCTDDMNPAYLADGSIVFISTRCRYGILCDQPDILYTTNLYKIDQDGKRMTRLTHSAVSESLPSVMSNGNILYTRWEYVDKAHCAIKCLWSMRPDGTMTNEVAGSEIALPSVMNSGREIPGSPGKFVFVGIPHCSNPNVGSVFVVDTNKDVRRWEEAYRQFTKSTWVNTFFGDSYVNDEGRPNGDGNGTFLYADPYPLSEDFMLVTFKPKNGGNEYAPDAYRLGVIESHNDGYPQPLYWPKDNGAWCVLPLRPRPRPVVKPSELSPELAKETLAGSPVAQVVVADVYQGLEGVERGAVKYLRINEQLCRPWAARRRWPYEPVWGQHAVTSSCGALWARVQWGIVPVEEDGSASFHVPADKAVFLQALDGDFMEVRRMRTYVNFRAGETRACVGCHEDHGTAPPEGRHLLALKRAPSTPGPQPGETTGQRTISYAKDVQPVLDEYCVECHGADEPKGDLRLTGELTELFNVSYRQLTDGSSAPRSTTIPLPPYDAAEGVLRSPENLHNRRAVRMFNEAVTNPVDGKAVGPYEFGSHDCILGCVISGGKSKRIDDKTRQRLTEAHKDLKIAVEDRIRVTTWIEANCQYYPSYWGRRLLEYRGHPNFRPEVTFAEARAEEPPVIDANHPRLLIAGNTAHREAFFADREKPYFDALIEMQHRTFACILEPDGTPSWWHDMPGVVRDAWMLEDGRTVLICGADRVEKVRVDTDDVVWTYAPEADRAGRITACQPLDNGHVAVAEAGTNVILEIDGQGHVARRIDTGLTGDVNSGLASVRKTPRGTYWLCVPAERAVVELDGKANELRRISDDGPSNVGRSTAEDVTFADARHAVELENGNILIGTGRGCVFVEVDRQNKVVWKLGPEELISRGVRRIAYAGGVEVMADGTRVLSLGETRGKRIIAVSPEKELLWFSDNIEIGNPRSARVLRR